MIGDTISHYRILEKLGEGGMGIVYRAHDTTLDRTVALKFLPHSLTSNPAEKERFFHEARAAAALTHQNIAVVYDIGEHDGQLFIVMECVEGRTLREKLQEGVGGQGPGVRIEEAVGIAAQIADGLAAAHEKGIVHRDIKPENIIISPKGQAKITDFGLAKLKGATRVTKAGSTIGTAAYMSPEQARGEEVDSRTDIFSLGAMLYEMITCHRPFKGEHEAALLYSLMNETPEPLARYKADVPPALQQIVDKALAKDKNERYQHADEMDADLRRLREETPGKVASSARRSIIPWLTAGILMLALLAVYFFYLTPASVSPRGKSIAVLPFQNLSDSKEDEYFSDGVTEDIIAHLSKINDLKVISRTSVMQYKSISKNVRDIGKELDVATVLEGSVRRSGNQIRIVAQLIDATNEGHLWAETYDKELTQVFTIQSEVAQRIADELKAKLSPAEKGRLQKQQTANTEAYQLYLRGRFYWNKRTLVDHQRSIEYFQKAITQDPGYAQAYAGLASTYVLLPQYGVAQVSECYTKAQTAALKSLEIDSTLGEAHTVLGEIAQDRSYDWLGAERHFRRAIELEPSYPTAHQWYSSLLCYLGRREEALAEAKRALELDPLSLVIMSNLGDTYMELREYSKAREQYQNIVSFDETFPWGHSGLAAVYEAEGNFMQAIEELKKAQNLGSNPYTLPMLGWTYERAGKKADARRVLNELLEKFQHGTPVAYGIGQLYYRLGDSEKAFEWFEKSYQERELWLVNLALDPAWDDLRADPRCVALLKKMGLRK